MKPSIIKHLCHLATAVWVVGAGLFWLAEPARAFEGRIAVDCTLGGQPLPLLYTVGTNALRIEVTGSSRPDPVDVVDLPSGTMTLLFPHNRSFVKLKPEAAATTGMPPRVGPQADAPNLPGAPGLGVLPMMPMPGEAMELKSTGEKTNLLGLVCEKYVVTQRGETMEIWATAGLLPFQNYVRNQRPRFGPRMIEEQWGDLVAAKKLFPLLAVLRFDNGPERLRFEVKSVQREKVTNTDAKLFAPPEGYFEIQPLPL